MARNGLKVEAFDIGKRGSSSDVVFDALRDAIIRGQLAEGEILRQDTIAQMFNVSRIPVREALQRLEAQGLVTSTRYKGVVVTPMSIAEIEEVFEFRALLDEHRLDGLTYGHFGDGCVHVRIDFPFNTEPQRFREFVVAARVTGISPAANCCRGIAWRH